MGDFCSDDQLGCLNCLTPKKIIEGLAKEKEEMTFRRAFLLTVLIEKHSQNRNPAISSPLMRQGHISYNCEMNKIISGKSDILSDDMVILSLQYATWWNGPTNAGIMFDTQGNNVARTVYYNKFAAGTDIIGPKKIDDTGIPLTLENANTTLAHPLGIEPMSRNAVSGSHIPLAQSAFLGDERKLEGYDDIIKISSKDKIEVTQDDIVCVHTRFTDLILKLKRIFVKENLETSSVILDRNDGKLQQCLTNTKFAALAADNYAVEAFPTRDDKHSCAVIPLHKYCLSKIGLYLGKSWKLTPLAHWLTSHNRYRFLLTAPSLEPSGPIASPLTPVARV